MFIVTQDFDAFCDTVFALPGICIYSMIIIPDTNQCRNHTSLRRTKCVENMCQRKIHNVQ